MWFDRQLQEVKKKPKVNPTEIDTLAAKLRDGLVKETAKVSLPKRKLRGVLLVCASKS